VKRGRNLGNYLGNLKMAEREGFEPPVPVKARTLSRRLVSTTHPSLRVVDVFELSSPNFIRSNLPFTECSTRINFPFQVSCPPTGSQLRKAQAQWFVYVSRA